MSNAKIAMMMGLGLTIPYGNLQNHGFCPTTNIKRGRYRQRRERDGGLTFDEVYKKFNKRCVDKIGIAKRTLKFPNAPKKLVWCVIDYDAGIKYFFPRAYA